MMLAPAKERNDVDLAPPARCCEGLTKDGPGALHRRWQNRPVQRPARAGRQAKTRLTDVAPYLSFDRHAPDSLAPAPPMRRRPELDRSRPSSAAPSDARILVRQRYDNQHRRLARQHPAEPGFRRHAFALGPAYDAAGRNDQQAPERPLIHPRRSSEAFPPSGRSLHGRETGPGSKVPPRPERLGRRCQSLDGGGNQRAMPGTVMSQRVTSSAFARAAISASSAAVCSCR